MHVRHPGYRLVVKADVPFPSQTSEDEWKLTRSREAGDVNAEVREAVDRDGYSLFGIGLSLSEIPKPGSPSLHATSCLRLNQIPGGNQTLSWRLYPRFRNFEEATMGKGLLLWLVGVPIPVILLLWLFFGR